MRSRPLIALVLTTIGVTIVSAVTHGGPAAAAPERRWGADYFPNVPLVTQDGRTVRFYDDLVKGKIVVFDLIYTRCGDACPLETARLSQVYQMLGDRMGKDVFFYSLSLDPDHDTPAVLKEFADEYHVGRGWLFLTGAITDVNSVRKKLGLGARANQDKLTDHSTSLVIGNDTTGHWLRHASFEDPRFLTALISNWVSERPERREVSSYETVPRLTAEETTTAASVFRLSCAACHTIGQGDGLGPDLHGVSATRDRAWLLEFIQAPDRLLARGDPIAMALFAKYHRVRMPNLRLSEMMAADLLAYIDARSAVTHK